MESLGVASSVAGLLALFSTCAQGYSALRAMRKFGKAALDLQYALEIEESRFLMWGNSMGINVSTDGSAEMRDGCLLRLDQWPLVLKMLTRVTDLFGDMEELKVRYGIEVDPSSQLLELTVAAAVVDDRVKNPTNNAIQVFNEQFRAERRKRATASIAAASGEVSILKRFRWVMGDADDFSKLVAQLRTLNDHLRGVLESMAQQELKGRFDALCLTLTRTNDPTALQSMSEATKTTYRRSISIPSSHKAMRLRLEAEFLERFDNQNYTPLPLSAGPKIGEEDELRIRSDQIYINEPREKRSFGLFKKRLVIVELRSVETSDFENTVEKQLRRVSNLVTLLGASTPRPAEFRVPDCLGYILPDGTISKSKGIGLVFSVPPPFETHPMEISTPLSLYSLISDKSRSRFKPSQSSRFALCRKLASAILHLHSVDWLHKGIRSDNIILFGNEGGERPSSAAAVSALITEPYLTGLEYSRLQGVGLHSEKIDEAEEEERYRHPMARGANRRPFQKSYDAYSFGCVLMEIAVWKPLSQLMRPTTNSNNNKRLDAAERTEKLRKDLIDSGDVAHWMGDIFSQVVDLCLGCKWESESEGNDITLEFYEKVVRRLDTCVV